LVERDGRNRDVPPDLTPLAFAPHYREVRSAMPSPRIASEGALAGIEPGLPEVEIPAEWGFKRMRNLDASVEFPILNALFLKVETQ
jgi:hypothetical protein